MLELAVPQRKNIIVTNIIKNMDADTIVKERDAFSAILAHHNEEACSIGNFLKASS